MQETKRRILIADSSVATLQAIFACDSVHKYEIFTSDTGPDCLQKIQTHHPDLVLIDLLLPEIHGIEILKKIKSHPKTAHIGVIISAALATTQNQHAAISLGANYFLTKPLDGHTFFLLLERFFHGHLQPNPSLSVRSQMPASIPHPPHAHTSYLKFWGTRGSNPVSGTRYTKFGGNTICAEINFEHTRIILDAGTGIHELGEEILTHPNSPEEPIHLFIGHTHWDHIIGFPFFAPLYNRSRDLLVRAPIGYEKNTKEIFYDMLSFGYFPLSMDETYAQVTFDDLRDGMSIKVGKVTISCHHAHHPGSTLCFKIKTPNQTIGYVTDNELLAGYHGPIVHLHKTDALFEPYLPLMHFLMDCDILIHEAQYLPHEYIHRVGWGHSSMTNATAFVKQLNCKEWIVIHHDPSHTDEDLQMKEDFHHSLLHECNLPITLKMAYDGMVIPL